MPYQSLEKVIEYITNKLNNKSLVGCYASNEELIKDTNLSSPYIYTILGFVDVQLKYFYYYKIVIKENH